MRWVKKVLKSNNVIGCSLALCVFIFVTVDHLRQAQDSKTAEKYKNVGLLKKKIFPVRGGDSRIREQLEYTPNSKKVKTIVLLDEHKAWQGAGIVSGKDLFTKKKCPVDTCSISYNPKNVDKADLVISRGSMVERPKLR